MIYKIWYKAPHSDGGRVAEVLQVKGTYKQALQAAAVGRQEYGWTDIEITDFYGQRESDADKAEEPAQAPVIAKAKRPRKRYEMSAEAAARKRDYDVKFMKTECRFIGLNLSRKNDADILAELESAKSMQARAKELMRKGIRAERSEK